MLTGTINAARTFDFNFFDQGGYGAVAGDKKLTEAEVVKARNYGWDVKEGYTPDKGIPEKINKNIDYFIYKEGHAPNNKDEEFFKFTDENGDFSWRETGATVLRTILYPINLLTK